MDNALREVSLNNLRRKTVSSSKKQRVSGNRLYSPLPGKVDQEKAQYRSPTLASDSTGSARGKSSNKLLNSQEKARGFDYRYWRAVQDSSNASIKDSKSKSQNIQGLHSRNAREVLKAVNGLGSGKKLVQRLEINDSKPRTSHRVQKPVSEPTASLSHFTPEEWRIIHQRDIASKNTVDTLAEYDISSPSFLKTPTQRPEYIKAMVHEINSANRKLQPVQTISKVGDVSALDLLENQQPTHELPEMEVRLQQEKLSYTPLYENKHSLKKAPSQQENSHCVNSVKNTKSLEEAQLSQHKITSSRTSINNDLKAHSKKKQYIWKGTVYKGLCNMVRMTCLFSYFVFFCMCFHYNQRGEGMCPVQENMHEPFPTSFLQGKNKSNTITYNLDSKIENIKSLLQTKENGNIVERALVEIPVGNRVEEFEQKSKGTETDTSKIMRDDSTMATTTNLALTREQIAQKQIQISKASIGKCSSIESITMLWKCYGNSNSVSTPQKASTGNSEHLSTQTAAITCVFLVVSLGLYRFMLGMRFSLDSGGQEETGYQIDQDNLTTMDTKVQNEKTDSAIPTGLYDCVEIAPVRGTPSSVKVRSVRRSRRISKNPPIGISTIQHDMVVDLGKNNICL